MFKKGIRTSQSSLKLCVCDSDYLELKWWEDPHSAGEYLLDITRLSELLKRRFLVMKLKAFPEEGLRGLRVREVDILSEKSEKLHWIVYF